MLLTLILALFFVVVLGQYLLAYFCQWPLFWLMTAALAAACFVTPNPVVSLGMLLYFVVYDIAWSVIWNTVLTAIVVREHADISWVNAFVGAFLARAAAPFIGLVDTVVDVYCLPRYLWAAYSRWSNRPKARVGNRSVPVTVVG